MGSRVNWFALALLLIAAAVLIAGISGRYGAVWQQIKTAWHQGKGGSMPNGTPPDPQKAGGQPQTLPPDSAPSQSRHPGNGTAA